MKPLNLAICLSAFLFLLFSCNKEDPPAPPIVTTLSVTDILTNSAKCGGDITDDGGAAIISRGIVWSLTNDPTLEGHTGLTISGSGVGNYTSDLSNLAPNTNYYVRAFATNSAAIGYGESRLFTTSSGDVINPTTGKTWMDRNLGATQVATSSTDANSYGFLFQWGRVADGHQLRTSSLTSILSSSNTPGHESFILVSDYPYDWRSPGNDNLWQGVNGINNPCPTGYRVPTEAELNAERLSWSSDNAAGALASPLKLPMAGVRQSSDGSLINEGIIGYYWTSSVSTEHYGYSRYMFFDGGTTFMNNGAHSLGLSVRCIKD
jgi:uncharacterized protein (TIGR02145 family)